MGVYIKGMDMPTRCYACSLCVGEQDDWSCAITHGSYIEYREIETAIAIDTRPEWCPLIPVSPHGRLIDGDELAAKCDDPYWCVWLGDIDNSPTVIPADKSVKKDEDTEPWLCLSCRNYPPSSTDGKPCSQCDTSDVWHSCYDPAESEED